MTERRVERAAGLSWSERRWRWLALLALLAFALWVPLPWAAPRSQTPEPAPRTAPAPAPAAEPAHPAKPGSRSNEGRFTPSEEVAPDNDLPFPVDI